MKLQIGTGHVLTSLLLVLSGALLYLAKLPVQPNSLAAWVLAVGAAISFSVQRSLVANAPPEIDLTKDPDSTQRLIATPTPATPSAGLAVPASAGQGASGPTGPHAP